MSMADDLGGNETRGGGTDHDRSDEESGASTGTDSIVGEWELPPTEILGLDHVFDALAHPRRRYVCYTLPTDDEWTLTELATKIAAWEHDVPEFEVDPAQRERVYVSLYHAHVPKLVADGILTFEEVSETVRPAENAEQVLQALEGIGSSIDTEQEAHARSEMDDEEN